MQKALWEKRRIWLASAFVLLCWRLQANLQSALGLVFPAEVSFNKMMESSPRIIDNAGSFTAENRTLMTTLSGCNMTKWIFVNPVRFHTKNKFPANRDDAPKPTVFAFREHDCLEAPVERRLTNMTVLREGDTIYIPIKKLQGFIIHELDKVQVPILIISGQVQLIKNTPEQQHIGTLLEHPLVIAWFCQNIDVYAPTHVQHPKLHPWPYGLADTPFRHEYARREAYREAVIDVPSASPDTTRIYSASNGIIPKKDVILHLAYFAVSTNKNVRRSIPNGIPSTNRTEYFQQIARAHFIFSPNGDRPECYRHYEAIGLGTVPITQLDAHVHRHLKGSVVFGPDQNWNTTYWNSSQALEAHKDVIPNRNMIFEDYWISHAEREIGRSFQWANDKQQPS